MLQFKDIHITFDKLMKFRGLLYYYNTGQADFNACLKKYKEYQKIIKTLYVDNFQNITSFGKALFELITEYNGSILFKKASRGHLNPQGKTLEEVLMLDLDKFYAEAATQGISLLDSNELREGEYTPDELAQWFNIQKESLLARFPHYLHLLRFYCHFTPVENSKNIIIDEVKIGVYSKKSNLDHVIFDQEMTRCHLQQNQICDIEGAVNRLKLEYMFQDWTEEKLKQEFLAYFSKEFKENRKVYAIKVSDLNEFIYIPPEYYEKIPKNIPNIVEISQYYYPVRLV